MKNQLQEKYNSIWQNYEDAPFKSLMERGYAFQYDEDEMHSDVMFLGINPSFRKGSINERYTYNKQTTVSYFEPFKKIIMALELEPYNLGPLQWTHLDILAFRETKQKYIDTLLKEEKGFAFVYEQVMIARERILHIQPKVIVVSNTKAKELMGKNRFNLENGEEVGVWMDFEFEFDMKYGSYRITNIPELAHTHVLFSSMLSGQRALDLGSRERLVWQVGQILKKDLYSND